MADEAGCRALFEHCLPFPYDPAWWADLARVNVQCDVAALMRYALAHRPQTEAAGRLVRRQMRRVLGAAPGAPLAVTADGVVIREERLDTFWRDAQGLFREHCLAVGEPEDEFRRKNLPLIGSLEAVGGWQFVTARLNGRMLGYLATIVSSSIEHVGVTIGTQTLFFVGADAKGMSLGPRLQRASIAALRDRGVSEIYMRAGVRGDGDRLDVLYRRLGAEPFGRLYKLDAAPAARAA